MTEETKNQEGLARRTFREERESSDTDATKSGQDTTGQNRRRSARDIMEEQRKRSNGRSLRR